MYYGENGEEFKKFNTDEFYVYLKKLHTLYELHKDQSHDISLDKRSLNTGNNVFDKIYNICESKPEYYNSLNFVSIGSASNIQHKYYNILPPKDNHQLPPCIYNIIYNIINECDYYSAAGASAAGASSSTTLAALGALAETTARS